MQITAITKYKHGLLYQLLQKLGWSQKELARRSKVTPYIICKIVNLVQRPTPKQATAIQIAFGEAGEYLDVLEQWPETFRGLRSGFKREQTADVQLENLLDCPEALLLQAPDTLLEEKDALDAAMSDIPDRNKEALWEIANGATVESAGKTLGVTGARARQIFNKGLSLLRHPKRIEKLKGFLETA